MPAPAFEITAPPGFEVIEEPTEISRSGMFAAVIEDDRRRRGIVIARQSRNGSVRSMTVFQNEWLGLADFLDARLATYLDAR